MTKHDKIHEKMFDWIWVPHSMNLSYEILMTNKCQHITVLMTSWKNYMLYSKNAYVNACMFINNLYAQFWMVWPLINV